MPAHPLDPESLVSEQPHEFDGCTYTARRNPGELRWQVFRDPGEFGPVGYLEAVHQPTESCRDDGWQLAVFDHASRPVGERGKRDAPGTVPAVDTFRNALVWLLARERGDA
jgi:hypothetical protein